MVQCKNRDCSILANFGLEGTAMAEFCRKHKKLGMVDIRGKVCAFDLCSMHSSYGKEGSGKREFCGKHKTADMVYIFIDTCASQGCSKQAFYGTNGRGKPEFCGEHKITGMVDVRYKPCAHKECSKFPSFGMASSRKAELCGEHKRPGMMNLYKKQCAHDECSKRPLYGPDGSKRAEFCGEHKGAGMVNVHKKRCAHEECSTFPSFGTDGSRKAEFCGEHKRADMVNVHKKQCAHEGCSKFPLHGTNGSRKAVFCGEHKMTGMVNVHNKRCTHEECSKIPLFGTDGSKKAEFCGEHKKEGMVDVRRKRCAHEECNRRPWYGTNGSRVAVFCENHKRTGMVYLGTKRCAHEGCSKQPSFGVKGSTNREFCSEHRETDLMDSVHKRNASEGCAKNAVYGLDDSRQQNMLCAQHFTNLHEEGAFAFEAARGKETEDMRDEASGQVALPTTRKRALRVEPLLLQVDKTSGSWVCGPSSWKRSRVFESEKPDASQETLQDSGLARQESPRPLHSLYTILPSQNSSDKSQATANLRRDDRAMTQALRPTRSKCGGRGKDGDKDPGTFSFVAGAKPAKIMPTQCVVLTNRGERKVPVSTVTTGSKRGELGCGGDSEDAEAGGADDLCAQGTFRAASVEKDVPATSSQVKNIQDKVVNLEKSVADAAANRAQAVAEATRRIEQESTAVIEALRAELGVALRALKDNKGTLEAVCEERNALRQQIRAQMPSADDETMVKAARTQKAMDKFQQRIEALRGDLTTMSTGWQSSKNDLKHMRQERDALRSKVTKIQAEVYSASNKIKTEAIKTEDARKIFKRRIKTLREMHSAASTGWENTNEDLKNIRHERDALREQVTKIQSQVASAASNIEREANKMEHAKEDYEQRIKAKEVIEAIASGAVIPASVPQSMMTGLSTIVSTAACLAAAAAAQSSVTAPPTEIRVPTANAVPSNVLHNVVHEGEVHHNMGLCERSNEAAEAGNESPSGCVQSSTVSIKPER